MNKLSDYQQTLIDEKIKIAEDRFVVLLDVSKDQFLSGEDRNLNIYCINSKAEIIWQVDTISDDTKFEDDMFLYLEINNKGELHADRFSGFEYLIDTQNGKAKRIGFHK